MYNNIFYKYKSAFIWTVKLLIIFAAFYFIYIRLHSNKLLSFTNFQNQISLLFNKKIWYLLILLLFTDANWFLEIFKWQTLVSTVHKIHFFEAYRQSLASLTAGLITPNKIGEFGAKALFFSKEKRKKILALTLIGNASQLLITTFFGLGGMLYLITHYNASLTLNKTTYLIAFLMLIALWFLLKKWLLQLFNYFKTISKKTYGKVLLFSFLRYVAFSHQFYFLLWLFNVEITYTTALALIFCMYFLASLIPGITLFDWAIKGSVALWVFSFASVNELTIVTITTLMWLLNFAIPALLGSVFVFHYNSENLV